MPSMGDVISTERGPRSQVQCGKAPVEPFTGEKADHLWEDWLPILEGAGAWYDWEEEETCRILQGKAQKPT